VQPQQPQVPLASSLGASLQGAISGFFFFANECTKSNDFKNALRFKRTYIHKTPLNTHAVPPLSESAVCSVWILWFGE
jgi:hypothetical protein